VSYRKDVLWTLDELRSEREALAEELAEVRKRHEPTIADLLARLEEETRNLMESEAVEEPTPPPAAEARPKRKRRAARPADPVADANQAENEKRRAAAKAVGVSTYVSTDDEGCDVTRCVDCDKPLGSAPVGCGNAIAHRQPGALL
jgi:hypothetical protein